MIYHGDCLEVLAGLPENSVDTCITDPPYELGFMGKKWDNTGVAFQPETWAAVYRVLKPGAILLAFGGTRTYHRIACAIEDAGFEIRDTIAWVYGSGFPKSYNISKGIESKLKFGNQHNTNWKKLEGTKETTGGLGFNKNNFEQGARPNNYNDQEHCGGVIRLDASTPEAQLWHGWGTALKPAFEPIVVAMKPIDGTFVNNALTWGVAGLNIDGGRVGGDGWTKKDGEHSGSENGHIGQLSKRKAGVVRHSEQGRFPANFIHDGSDEVVELFPDSDTKRIDKPSMCDEEANTWGGTFQRNRGARGYDGNGSAARFFYCAKSSRIERNGGLDGYLTVKYNNDKSNSGGLSWKDVSTVAVQLLRKVMSDLAAMSFNIGESGESITALCPKDSLSTTLTAISKIIELKILHSLTLSLTNEYTVGANYEMANGGNLAESVVSLRKWILTITSGCLESARGASSVALQTLLKIRNADEWSQATNFHSTVKPLALMRYLARLTKTPTGGVVLDPFMGSGTTGIACVLEGREFIGIEREAEYIEIAEKRIEHAQSSIPVELPLFAEIA